MTDRRPIHLLDPLTPGLVTRCGRGGLTFSAPTTGDPAKATCKSCLKSHAAEQCEHERIDRDHGGDVTFPADSSPSAPLDDWNW